jgi:hypothetical protein
MPAPQNQYVPGNTHGEVTVPATGSVQVDTGMKDLTTATVSIAQASVATAAGITWERVARVKGDGTAKILIKSWAADGLTAGSSAMKASWSAWGR